MTQLVAEERSRLDGLRLRWVRLERTERSPGDLPSATAVVPHRDPAELSEHVVANAYRELFWSFDIDPTKTRPAGEALARRVAHGKALPEILPLVDAYNLVSAVTLVPMSAFDEAALHPPVHLGRAREGERFEPIGGQPQSVEEGHPVIRDAEGIVSLLAHRDGQRTALSDASENAVLVACGPRETGPRVLPEAIRMFEQYANIVGWRFRGAPQSLEL